MLLLQKAYTNIEPPYPSYEFRDFANLFIPNSTAELFK